jgi:hypothetical protein
VRPTRPEWALLAVALALCLWLVSQATWLPVSDTHDYHQLARSLANGDGYAQAYEGYGIVCLFAGYAIVWLGVRRSWWTDEPAPAAPALSGADRPAQPA